MSSISDLFNDDNEYSSVTQEINTTTIARVGIEELMDILSSPDLEPYQRTDYFYHYYLLDEPTVLETIHNFLTSYIENETLHLKAILQDCLQYDFLPFTIKLKIMTSISSFNIDDQLYFVSIHPIWSNLEKNDISDIPILFDVLSKINNTRVEKYLVSIFKISRLSDKLKLNYLVQMSDISSETGVHVCLRRCAITCLYMITNPNIAVLVAQRIQDIEEKELFYLMTLVDDGVEGDLAASYICDFFLSLEKTDEDRFHIFVSWAKERLKAIKGFSKNIYESSQNIHQVSADVESFIERIMEFDSSSIESIIEECNVSHDMILEEKEKCYQSLKRIVQDNSLYTTKGLTLLTIVKKVWSCIINHEYKVELRKRFWQECIDMSETCSSGHMFRLINIFTGYEEGIKIDVRVELRSVVFYRLQKLIESIDDSYRDNIMTELSGDKLNEENEAESAIQSYLYKTIVELKNELWKDYSPLLESQKFEEYYRSILTEFTTGNK